MIDGSFEDLPENDHTLGDGSGHMMTTELSVGTLGEEARIRGPNLPKTGDLCQLRSGNAIFVSSP